MGYAHDYATAILHRGREPMPPVDFTPDWSDAPRRTKVYPGALTFRLPYGFRSEQPGAATVDAGIHGRATAAPFTLERLSAMLWHSYGLLGRRLGVQANTDLAALPVYSHANWHRGTASGGGLYPCSVYWVAGPGAGPSPGVYFYSSPRHAMQRLLAGAVSAHVREALSVPTTASNFLVVGVKYWQNAFKYNNFAYHTVSMDVGALLQTWRTWVGARGGEIAPVVWFDQAALSDLLGLPADGEGLFAVVPLDWETAAGPVTVPDTGSQHGGPGPRVRRRDRERSRRVLTFDALQRIHRTTAEAAGHRPPVGALADAGTLPVVPGGSRIALPAPAAMDAALDTALRARRSSFGRFEAAQPITAGQLAASLAAAHAAAAMPCEITAAGDPPLAKLYAFVNHVDGVPAGSYEYLPGTGALRLINGQPPDAFLQRTYFLANYNLEQAAAVIVPTIRTAAVLDAAGDRAYNVVNATIGAIAQNFYTAAAALDLGAGVALGFDNISYVEHLGLGGTGEAPLLIMLIGHERRYAGDFRYRLE